MRDGREEQLLRVALRQHDLFTLRQALDCGFSRHAIRRRLASGQWEEVATRVYVSGAVTLPDERQVLHARVLETGGVACGRSAAALHEWLPFPSPPEVAVSREARRNSHRSVRITDSLPTRDIMTVDDIRVTTPVRTLIDLGALLSRSDFEEVFDHALASRAVRRHRLETRAKELRAPRRPGCALVLRLLAELHPEIGRSANRWEAAVLRAVSRLGLPSPRVNYRVRLRGGTRHIDLAWPDKKIALELDGFMVHTTRRVFEDDRTRQNDLVAAGWEVYRITWVAFRESPERALAHVAAALRR